MIRNFNYDDTIEYLLNKSNINWEIIWYMCGILYLPIVFGIQKLHNYRCTQNILSNKRFITILRNVWVVWNFSLSIFSLLGAIYTSKGFITIIKSIIFDNKYTCSWDIIPQNGAVYKYGLTKDSNLGRWIFLFYVSKAVEFLDTIFLSVLNKPILFLHWYHHLATYGVSTYLIVNMMPYEILAIFINYTIHTIMYSYFGGMILFSKAIWLKRMSYTISTLQTLQMFIVILFAIIHLINCNLHSTNAFLWIHLGMYSVYAIIFSNMTICRITQKQKEC